MSPPLYLGVLIGLEMLQVLYNKKLSLICLENKQRKKNSKSKEFGFMSPWIEKVDMKPAGQPEKASLDE